MPPSGPQATDPQAPPLKGEGGARSILPQVFLDAVEGKEQRLDMDLLALAFQYSKEKHAGQTRSSGEEYITHCTAVASILGEIHPDTVTIAASFLHDVVEDSEVGLDEIRQEFGAEIATLVDGLTKISRVEFRSLAERQVENYRKLLLSMAADARVIIIKLADRLHNMRTLEHLDASRQHRIALETREIYAPLAHRLGMARVRWELEDLAFKFLEPAEYKDLSTIVAEKRSEREDLIRRMVEPLSEELKAAGLDCLVHGRAKHLWSIWRKMQKREKPYEEIYDVLAVRVVLPTIRDCYHGLGVIHNTWTPLTERFHDYIATPKSNLYQSLHTTIFGPGGRLYEIQLRTDDMHRTAELGIAAHWRYKEGSFGDEVDEKLSWFRQVLEWQQETHEPEEFLEFLRIDLFQDEIFVFTPAGDVKQLPRGATPIDFAFAVHTEVGNRCAGAKVNGRIAPLARALKNGDRVEILTSDNQRPNRDWLAFVRTSRARHQIRNWIRDEEQEAATQLGKEILAREWRRRKAKPTDSDLDGAAEKLSIGGGADGLYATVGRGDIGIARVVHAVLPDERDPAKRTVTPLSKLVQRVWTAPKGVKIQGMDNLMVRYSQCCQPVPGDDVMGYITVGRGISIHRRDCPNVLNLPNVPERRVVIDWGTDDAQRFLVRIVMEGTDRHGLFADMARAVSDTGTNIQSASITSVEGGMQGQFVVEVENLSQLKKVLRKIRRVKGVLSVERKESFGDSDLTLAGGSKASALLEGDPVD